MGFFDNMGSSSVDIEDAAPDSPPTPTSGDIVAMELAREIEDAEKSCGTIRHQQSLAVAKAAALNVLGEMGLGLGPKRPCPCPFHSPAPGGGAPCPPTARL